MICAICGLEIETIDEAIEENWIPYFYEGETEHGPVCASCVDQMICRGEDGKMDLKVEYRGKVQYLDVDYFGETRNDLPPIRIRVSDEREKQLH